MPMSRLLRPRWPADRAARWTWPSTASAPPCVLGAAVGGAPFRRIMLYEPPGSQAGLGPRSGRPGRGKAGPRPERRMDRNAHPRRDRRSWRVCPAAAARARNSLVRSAAMAWVITGCMTFSSLANRPSRALLLTLSLRGTTVPRRRTHRQARHGLEDGTRCLMHSSRPSACLAWRSLSRSYHSVRVWALSARPPLPAVAVCASACSRRGLRHRAVSDQDGRAFPRSVRGCHDAGSGGGPGDGGAGYGEGTSCW